MQTGPVDPGVLAARLRAQTEIDDPLTGAAEPLEVEARSKFWPDAARWIRIELRQVTEAGARRLEEYRFTPAADVTDLPPALSAAVPVALMFERSPNGASRARLYSSQPLVSARRPLLPIDTHLSAEDDDGLMQRYFAAVRSADLTSLIALFEPTGSLQRYDGVTVIGRDALRATYGQVLGVTGRTLRFCTALRDPIRAAYEMLRPDDEPALGVYERSAAGRLANVRLYG